MANFQFRLQRVLEYREMQEGWAKDAYIEARGARLEVEATITAIRVRRAEALDGNPESLDERMTLERYVQQLDEEVRTQNQVVEILAEEEGKALMVWQERKQELEAMNKLREHLFAEFQVEEKHQEQVELDEWTITRRKSA